MERDRIGWSLGYIIIYVDSADGFAASLLLSCVTSERDKSQLDAQAKSWCVLLYCIPIHSRRKGDGITVLASAVLHVIAYRIDPARTLRPHPEWVVEMPGMPSTARKTSRRQVKGAARTAIGITAVVVVAEQSREGGAAENIAWLAESPRRLVVRAVAARVAHQQCCDVPDG